MIPNQDEFWKKVGTNVREMRELKGFSQKDLARKVRYQVSRIIQLENGKQIRNIIFLNQVCNAIDTNLDYITTHDPFIYMKKGVGDYSI
ncbi:helix-turn-helix transcriptional regulator [Candidatus Pacearchaeota archaeon]|nr:helix-turn-helix transcriptional regulator [Candidatus Pacearchaeota archaeon]